MFSLAYFKSYDFVWLGLYLPVTLFCLWVYRKFYSDPDASMVEPQYEGHVNVIRETHRRLRRKLADGDDFEKVWKLHCSNDRLLNDYSSAMRQLATTTWTTDCDGKDRTKWCKEFSVEYFYKEGLKRLLEKDERRKHHYETGSSSSFVCGPTPRLADQRPSSHNTEKTYNHLPSTQGKLQLLDVGSCYSPFSRFRQFDTVAIDLAPANEKVHKCDFISVKIDDEISKSSFMKSMECSSLKSSNSLEKLPSRYFDVVVFSLLLSYIPCPRTRWLMCQKAHQVMETNGLLLIVTPDSSHQNRNAALMKQWKVAIENIGFQRVQYCKDKHLHFLAFRKVPENFIWDKRKIEDTTLAVLHIPQDNNNVTTSNK